MNKRYQCFYLDPEQDLGHAENPEILFESDCLAECCHFVYKKFKEEKKDICVWQPAKQCYREIYQNRKRDKAGRFLPRGWK